MSEAQTLSSKKQINAILTDCLQSAHLPDQLASKVHSHLLRAKVRFPLLEYATEKLAEALAPQDQLPFCDTIADYQTIGGNVILGMMLQYRLSTEVAQSLNKAIKYIQQGQQWYVSDIIGERVFGQGLRDHFEETLTFLHTIKEHPSHWVVRSIGAGSHFAMKRGLSQSEAQEIFKLLLSLGLARHKQIKTGIGWAAKTTARYHPEVVNHFQSQWTNRGHVGKWFETKVHIGLGKNRYDQGG